MSGGVHKGGVATRIKEGRSIGPVSRKDARFGKNVSQCRHLRIHQRRASITETDDQRRCASNVRFFETAAQDRSARRVSDLEAVDKIARTIMKSMKRKMMQDSVGHDDDVGGQNLRYQRFNQGLI